jgi:uncharacterized protein
VFYYPKTTEQHYNPKIYKLNYEDVWIESEGKKIHAWWFPAQSEKTLGTVLFFHGNGENLSSHFLNLIWLPILGYNYLIFDYPGYGKSEGETTQKGTVDSGRAALNWIWKNKDPRPIIYGQSMGGAIAMRVIEDEKNNGQFRAVILDSTFKSYKAVASKVLKKSYVTWILHPLAYVLVSNSYAVKDPGHISPIPTLVFHSKQDQVVHPQLGDELFAELKEPKKMIQLERGEHNSVFWIEGGKYREDLLSFLKEHP